MKPAIVLEDKNGDFVAVFVENISCVASSKVLGTLIEMENGSVIETNEPFDNVIKMCENCYK